MKRSRLWWYVAWRFLRAKNKTQVVNILTALSVIAVAMLIAAFVIIVSVFNGFDSHFKKLYGSTFPDIVVRMPDHTNFEPDPQLISTLESDADIKYGKILETKAFADYEGNQSIVKLRGVSPNYFDIVDLDITSSFDKNTFKEGNTDYCYFSYSTAQSLGLNENFNLIPIDIRIPKNTKSNLVTDQISAGFVYPRGAYSIEESQGEKDMIADYEYIEGLSSEYGMVTEIAIKSQSKSDIKNQISQLKKKFPQYDILSNNEQNESLFKIVNTEKYLVYAILIFMLFLSSLNIIGVLLMTIIEKRRDIALFQSIGTDHKQVQGIFLRLGTLIGAVGTSIGLLLGLGIALGQQYFGWLKMNSQNSVEPFPVEVQALNIVFIVFVAVLISVLASWLPSRFVDRGMQALRWVD